MAFRVESGAPGAFGGRVNVLILYMVFYGVDIAYRLEI